MQDKKQYISPIKQRILQFANTLGISKREFYAKIGVSRGTLESPTGITEDILAKFIATYPDVCYDWLLSGRGDILKSQEAGAIEATQYPVENSARPPEILNYLREREQEIKQLNREIGRLEERLRHVVNVRSDL